MNLTKEVVTMEVTKMKHTIHIPTTLFMLALASSVIAWFSVLAIGITAVAVGSDTLGGVTVVVGVFATIASVTSAGISEYSRTWTRR